MRTTVLLTFAVLFSATSAAKSQAPSETKATLQEEASKHVTSAVLLKKVSPEYPKKARKQHVEGTVRLHAIIAKDGSVKDLEVLAGDPLLVDAALKSCSPVALPAHPAQWQSCGSGYHDQRYVCSEQNILIDLLRARQSSLCLFAEDFFQYRGLD